MPRDPLAASIQLVLGLVLGGAGILMLGWAVTTYLNVELGFNAVMWAAEHSPVTLAVAPERLANAAIRNGSLIAIGVAGFFLWAIGSALLRAARANLRPTEHPVMAVPAASTS